MLAIALLNENQHQQKLLDCSVLRVGRAGDHDLTDDLPIGDFECQFLAVNDPLVAEKQFTMRWERSTAAEIELANHGRSLALSSGPRIHAGRTVRLELPVSFYVGDSQVQIFDADAEHSLDVALTSLSKYCDNDYSNLEDKRVSPGSDTLAAWLQTLSDLQSAAAGSQELFELAARAVFNPGGLDGGLILLPTSGGWEIAASHLPYPDHGIVFREDLVRESARTRQAIYHDAKLADRDETIDGLHAAVVCPVIGENEEVVAAVYGFRSLHRRNNRRGVRLLEAQFVQVVADALSAGMIRLVSEAEAARSKVLLEQAFSPKIVRQLQSNPDFLDGQNREVSVLFADLRQFSTISERIGTRDTYEMLADLMDRFSRIITEFDGVIIDFYGDGISAFWNAPLNQPKHAVLACQTGIEMLNCLPELNQIWADRIGQELKIGIGIHTGEARVGNSGSRTRLKYGPRGSTVNLASRLESATKRIGVPMLVSAETAKQVDQVFDSQRIIKALLTGINSPTDICRLFAKGSENEIDSYLAAYENVLGLFELGRYTDALIQLAELKRVRPEDPVTDFLMNAVTCEQKRIEESEPDSTNADKRETTGAASPIRLDAIVNLTPAASQR